ncbi:MAG: hypothetical protein B7Z45_07960 [Azorhizobium sp. 12-66-6]|nr:MAG: hypothetical protein B7Z45_07960 [Azorhizobium sp. 12-66-6]
MGLGLAAAWAITGWSFLQQRYVPINWAIAPVVPAVLLQAGLLLLAGLKTRVRDQWGLRFGGPDGLSWAGLGLAGFGLLYPALTLVYGRPLSQAEAFALAPDPTALVTIGLLLCVRSPHLGVLLAVLLPVPLLWCLFSGLTLLAMGEAQAFVLFAAVILSLGLLCARLLLRARPMGRGS